MGEINEAQKLFISYSHKDDDLRVELEKHLALLERSGIIESWSDREIKPGNLWEQEIDRKIESANIILLLISADFIQSNYCFGREMRTALDRHKKGEAKVIPIILRACDWQNAPFGKLQVLPKDGLAICSWKKRDEAFTSVAREIRRAISDLQLTGHPSKSTGREFTSGAVSFQGSPTIANNIEQQSLTSYTYKPPVDVSIDGCILSHHRNSKLLPLTLVSLDNPSEKFGMWEIVFALFFGALLCGINIWQRWVISDSDNSGQFYDALMLNLAMGASAFFLTAEILIFLNYESEKISLFIKGITKRLIFSYLFALCVIEVVSHLDSFTDSKFKLLIVGQLIFCITGAIEAFIDLKVATCFNKISYHYKKHAEIYRTAGTWAKLTLLFNLAMAFIVCMSYLKYFPSIDEIYILSANFIINSVALVKTRWQISHIKENQSNV